MLDEVSYSVLFYVALICKIRHKSGRLVSGASGNFLKQFHW